MIGSIKMSRHSNTTISFSGADGVGKSTQIMLLKQYFENNGITYRILYARAGYNKVCLSLLKRIKKRPTVLNRGLYGFINYVQINYLFGILKEVKKNNQVLLMDRTLIDSMVDKSMLLKKEYKIPKIIRGGWKRTREIRIYLDADIDNIEKRIKNRGEKFDYEYAKTQLVLYLRLLEENKDQFIYIDANRDEESIFKDILNILLAGGKL